MPSRHRIGPWGSVCLRAWRLARAVRSGPRRLFQSAEVRGAVGIEALSRGARRAIFIEHFPAAVKLLRANLGSLGIATAAPQAESFAGAAEVIAADVIAGLEQLASRGTKADIVFADPPYADAKAYSSLLDWLGDSELIAAGGRVVLEHSRRLNLPVVAGMLERMRLIEQGDTALSFYVSVLAA